MRIKKVLISLKIQLCVMLLITNYTLADTPDSSNEQESVEEEENISQIKEGNNFNQTIQDVDDYFKSLGTDIGEGLNLVEKFDRDLESIYNEYKDYESGDFTAFCNSIVEGGCSTLSGEGFANEMALQFLESELGINRSTVSFLGNFFEVDLANGRISVKDYETIAGNLLGADVRGKECPFSLRIIAGGCEDDTRLPIVVTREATEPKDNNLGSGDLRPLSQPTHLLLDEYTLNTEIEPNSKIELANLYDREVARNVAYGFVEQRGQEWLGDNLLDSYILARESNEIYKEIGKISGESLNLSVTQDVMKSQAMMTERLGHIIVNQTMLDTRNQASLLSLQQEQAYSLQLQANISDSLDRSLRNQRAEAESASFRAMSDPIYIPGFKY